MPKDDIHNLLVITFLSIKDKNSKRKKLLAMDDVN